MLLGGRLRMPRLPSMVSVLALAALGCQQPIPHEPDLCDALMVRCGGIDPENWYTWCESECVPENARRIPCDENDACVLCDVREDAPDPSNTVYFGLPTEELEYLWTLTDAPREPIHPPTEPAPTGAAFIDEPESFVETEGVGEWLPYTPFPGIGPGDVGGFCEPGPNRYVASNVLPTTGAMVLRAQRMAESEMSSYCPEGRCRVGPYTACDAPPTGCQYREEADINGLGYASQADRAGDETYGYGRYRAVLRASGDFAEPVPGFVYAFFTQGNLACVEGMPNIETNTSEVDVEISAGQGEAGGQPFCTSEEMCVQVSTWVSSDQGIVAGGGGTLRHQVSGFRFRDRTLPGRARTYGWDWEREDVRFVYDADPLDCDEANGECDPAHGSLAICRHLRFVPRRPAPLHFQLWNAWWAGDTSHGTEALMSVERVWHDPYPE